MRVHFVNVHCVAQDAIVRSMMHQVRSCRARGDEVRVFVNHASPDMPPEIRSCLTVVGPGEDTGSAAADADLCVVHYGEYYELADVIERAGSAATILVFHNVTPPELAHSPDEAAHWRHSLGRVGALASHVDLVLADSDYSAHQLVTVHGCDPRRVRVLSLAVPADEFSPGPAVPEVRERHALAPGPIVLFVGRMARSKRIDLLVEALPLVRARVPGTSLLLVGDDRTETPFIENVAQWRARAERLGVGDAVCFTGRVSDLAAYYRSGDVYVTASEHEGFGVPPVEAMATGLPVVATRAGAHVDVLGDAALLVDLDAAALADATVRVLSDATLRADLVRRGAVRARAFTLDTFERLWLRAVDDASTAARARAHAP